MDPLTLGLMGGGMALGAIGSVFNNERNIDEQRKAQQTMLQLQQKTWDREDNAVQRRRADMVAAGFSPVLAAGAPAQAGSPVKIDPVVSQDGYGTEAALSGMMRAAQTQQSIFASKAAEQQTELMKAQVNKTNMETAVLGKESALYGNTGGHPKYQDVWGKRISGILTEVGKVMPSRKALEDYKNEVAGKYSKAAAEMNLSPAQAAEKAGRWHLHNSPFFKKSIFK